ncbi:PREDICTED: proline-rich protein 2-like [Dipodomys ordii]|uniref:Proline-rich protein 2-like n=1 Tax=Dipodomys ordii TaxID=10020 RepID=A0A1S3GW93_DIPOR|nr:PREDICTED: proline-rich protein 2-like [Dipodomys ordii]
MEEGTCPVWGRRRGRRRILQVNGARGSQGPQRKRPCQGPELQTWGDQGRQKIPNPLDPDPQGSPEGRPTSSPATIFVCLPAPFSQGAEPGTSGRAGSAERPGGALGNPAQSARGKGKREARPANGRQEEAEPPGEPEFPTFTASVRAVPRPRGRAYTPTPQPPPRRPRARSGPSREEEAPTAARPGEGEAGAAAAAARWAGKEAAPYLQKGSAGAASRVGRVPGGFRYCRLEGGSPPERGRAAHRSGAATAREFREPRAARGARHKGARSFSRLRVPPARPPGVAPAPRVLNNRGPPAPAPPPRGAHCPLQVCRQKQNPQGTGPPRPAWSAEHPGGGSRAGSELRVSTKSGHRGPSPPGAGRGPQPSPRAAAVQPGPASSRAPYRRPPPHTRLGERSSEVRRAQGRPPAGPPPPRGSSPAGKHTGEQAAPSALLPGLPLAYLGRGAPRLPLAGSGDPRRPHRFGLAKAGGPAN